MTNQEIEYLTGAWKQSTYEATERYNRMWERRLFLCKVKRKAINVLRVIVISLCAYVFVK